MNKNKVIRFLICLALVILSTAIPISKIVFAEDEGETGSENINLGRIINTTEIKDHALRNYIVTLQDKYGFNALYENMFLYTDMEELDLSNRETKVTTLEGLELFNFSNIISVNFSENSITLVPQHAFYTMKNLVTLNLSNNNLKSIDIEIYAENVDLSNNSLSSLTIRDKNLKHLDISNNNFRYDQRANNSKITITEVNPEDYEIIAYNNIMAGENGLTNAYLGLQNLINYRTNDSDCDYVLYSNSGSSGYKIYAYPYGKICVGKDETGNLIYKQIKCRLYYLNNETNQYELVKEFNKEGNLDKNLYEEVVPLTGYYKIEFITEDGEPIYKLDSNHEVVTEIDYNDNVYKVRDERYADLIIRAIPYVFGNVYMEINDKFYTLEVIEKGPVNIKLYTPIENATFRYIINGAGVDYVDEQVVPFEGDEIYLDKTSYYTVEVWVVVNGVRSESTNFALQIVVPRKLTIENWVFLILGIIAVLAGSTYAIYVFTNKNVKKDINDFEW